MATNSTLWQKALHVLQEKSWELGRAPMARQWLQFFTSTTVSPNLLTSTTQMRRLFWAPPLPLPPRLFICESVMDVVRWARLEQLLTSPAGILKETYNNTATSNCVMSNNNNNNNNNNNRDCVGDGNSDPLYGIPEDVNGIFLSLEPSHALLFPTEMEQLLYYCCAIHETPCHLYELECWLREVTAFVEFFLLHPMPEAITLPQRRLVFSYAEILRILHYALCALFLRPSTVHAGGDVSSTDPLAEEVALLALWLLRAASQAGTVSTTEMLRQTQWLLASRTGTQSWILQLPTMLSAHTTSSGDGCRVKSANGGGRGSHRLVEMQDRSPICQLARQVIPTSSRIECPNVRVPFVDQLVVRNGRARVHEMHEQLSRIASTSGK